LSGSRIKSVYGYAFFCIGNISCEARPHTHTHSHTILLVYSIDNVPYRAPLRRGSLPNSVHMLFLQRLYTFWIILLACALQIISKGLAKCPPRHFSPSSEKTRSIVRTFLYMRGGLFPSYTADLLTSSGVYKRVVLYYIPPHSSSFHTLSVCH